MTYPRAIGAQHVWITNCAADEVFERIVQYQLEYPDLEICADVPFDMSWRVHGGAPQHVLIRMNYWGIYRKDESRDLSHVPGRRKTSLLGVSW